MADASSPAPYHRHLAAVVPDALELAQGALSDNPVGSRSRTIATLTLDADRTVATEDDDITVTATLLSRSGATGAVYFCIDDEIVAAADLRGNRARTTLTCDAGAHTLTAHYIGDTRHHPADSMPITITVATAN